MAQYSYTAKDGLGKVKKGKIEANSQREAYGKLRAENLKVVQIEEIPETIWNKDIELVSNKLKQRDFVIYLHQFATLIRAGITIVNATNILAQQTESKVLKRTLTEMEKDLREGTPLSDAYEKYPKLFKPLFINMIRAGEYSGTVDETLERLATYYDKQYRTRQKVISALTYPIILSILTTIVVMFLLFFIVPIFIDLFSGLDTELPGITLFVIRMSDGVQKFWWLIFLIVGMVSMLIVSLKKQAKGRYYLDNALLKTPIFGKVLQKSAIARTTLTLSSLFESSVPVLQAVDITEKVVGNEVIATILHEGRNSLERGESMTVPMKDHWAIPPLVTQMIAIGEQTGSLDTMLAEVASFYEAEVEATTDSLKALIEPVMIIILAGIVGVIVLAIMLPMFEMLGTAR